ALANDTGLQDGGLTVTATAPAQGTATVNADNTIAYTPAHNYNGVDAFEYTVTDVDGDKSTATVSITVAAVNDAPSLTAIANTSTAEDTPTGAIGFTVSDPDNSASSLSVT